MDKPLIILEDLTRIRYQNKQEQFPIKILDWEKTKEGYFAWEMWEKQWSETIWDGPHKLNDYAKQVLRLTLDDVAKRLGLSIGDYRDIEHVNMRILVEDAARFSNSFMVPSEKPEENAVIVWEYFTKEGQMIYLKKNYFF